MQQSPVNNYLSTSTYHHSQHQHHANAAVQATADYFEQQFKLQQQKNYELEQQMRSLVEQSNEFKVDSRFFWSIFCLFKLANFLVPKFLFNFYTENQVL